MISWKIETDEMSPTYCIEGFPSRSTDHGWPKQRSAKLLSGQHRDQSTGRPRKLKDMEKNAKEEKASQRECGGVPSNLDRYSMTISTCIRRNSSRPGKEPIEPNNYLNLHRARKYFVSPPTRMKDVLIFKILGSLQESYHLSSETKLTLD